jgi:hypothetical protein
VKRTWNTAKLDLLLTEIHANVVSGLEVDPDGDVPQVVGHWMYRLLACQDGPLPEIERSVSGPLFGAPA